MIPDLLALSIRQPWATSIVHFGKRVENRAWSGSYLRMQNDAIRRAGDRFLIHASKGLTSAECEDWEETAQLAGVAPTAAMLAAAGIKTYRDLPLGGIIGIATFVEWVTMHDSPWFFGPGALVLTEVAPLPFTPCRGALGFFRPRLQFPGSS